MRRKQVRVDPAEAHAARLAWWAAFVTTAILVLGLSFVHAAGAATPAAGAPRLAISTPFEFEAEEEEEREAEEEGGEWEAEGCEAGAIEAWDAEEEELECEVAEEDESPPPRCRLESADAIVSADLVHRRLRLDLRYRASRSTPVTVKYFLRGSRGPLTLPAERPRIGRRGVFRTAQRLNPTQARKVAAARSFLVRVRPGGAPGYCSRYLDRALTVRRAGRSGPIWIAAEPTFPGARHA